jgi:DNA-binding LacI/PurR family transcriptional regulator
MRFEPVQLELNRFIFAVKPILNRSMRCAMPFLMPKSVTLLDVAQAVGVSKATVSNVFSRPERVRPDLKARVEAAARQLGYSGPDPRGRTLSSGKVNAIGIVPFGPFGVSHFFKNAYQRDFLAGVSDVCEARGLGVSLVSGRGDQEPWGIKTALVDGFIFTAIEQVPLAERGRLRHLPFVVMDYDGAPDIRSVSTANRDGARQATRHLLDLGHRRFVIGSPMYSFRRAPVFHPPSATERTLVASGPPLIQKLAGVADALAEAGLSIHEMPIIEACGTPAEEAAFGNGAAMLLQRAPEATAVIALTDSVALAVLDQARKLGITVPDDISVVGFDDLPAAAVADPPLTTVHQSAFENGRTAARLLLESGAPQQVLVPVSLVVRRSTARPRA